MDKELPYRQISNVENLVFSISITILPAKNKTISKNNRLGEKKMDTTTFSDIFKSSFLEKTASFSLIDSVLSIGFALLLGLFIYIVYKKTFNGVIYSHSFNLSLIIMTMATSIVIMGISQNVLLSLGMVGALSI